MGVTSLFERLPKPSRQLLYFAKGYVGHRSEQGDSNYAIVDVFFSLCGTVTVQVKWLEGFSPCDIHTRQTSSNLTLSHEISSFNSIDVSCTPEIMFAHCWEVDISYDKYMHTGLIFPRYGCMLRSLQQ